MKAIVKLLFTALLISGFLVGGQALAEGYGKQKVVYHINYDNPKQQAGALRNIQNHINAVGSEKLDLKVVLHGNGLALLLDPDSLTRLKKFKNANADDKMTVRSVFVIGPDKKIKLTAFWLCRYVIH